MMFAGLITRTEIGRIPWQEIALTPGSVGRRLNVWWRIGVRSTGSFKCHVCRAVVRSWAGDYDYIDWMAFEP